MVFQSILYSPDDYSIIQQQREKRYLIRSLLGNYPQIISNLEDLERLAHGVMIGNSSPCECFAKCNKLILIVLEPSKTSKKQLKIIDE